MNKQRLLKVAQRMEDVHLVLEAGKAPIEFDMYEWGHLKEPGKFEGKEDLSCLTAACAIGHCGSLFKDEGFSLVVHSMEKNNVIPAFENWRNWDAIVHFFDITSQEARYLFLDTRYRFIIEEDEDGYEWQTYQPMPAEVADRIRRFVRSGKIGKW